MPKLLAIADCVKSSKMPRQTCNLRGESFRARAISVQACSFMGSGSGLLANEDVGVVRNGGLTSALVLAVGLRFFFPFGFIWGFGDASY